MTKATSKATSKANLKELTKKYDAKYGKPVTGSIVDIRENMTLVSVLTLKHLLIPVEYMFLILTVTFGIAISTYTNVNHLDLNIETGLEAIKHFWNFATVTVFSK